MTELEKLIEKASSKLTEEEYDAIATLEWEKGILHGKGIAFGEVLEILKKETTKYFLNHMDEQAKDMRKLIYTVEDLIDKNKG